MSSTFLKTLNTNLLSPFLAAPMVHQSELTFRLLCRRYNVSLAATPMLHSRIFASTPAYRTLEYQTHPDDAPLIAQLCGAEPHDLVNAAAHLHHCDIIDINLGCPQAIAKRGNYGAYLLSDVSKMQTLVSALASTHNGTIPVSAKIRILPTPEETMQVAQALVEAGAQMLTVHGRTKEQNKQSSGAASWEAVREVVQELQSKDVVVVSNGGVETLAHAQECLTYTGAWGCMSAEGLLCNPSLFYDVQHDDNIVVQDFLAALSDKCSSGTSLHIDSDWFSVLLNMRQLALAKEYMQLAHIHSNNYLKPVRSHLFKFCHALLNDNTDVRTVFAKSRSLEEMEQGVLTLIYRTKKKYRNATATAKRCPPKDENGVNVMQDTIEWVLDQSQKEEEETMGWSTAKYHVAAVAALTLHGSGSSSVVQPMLKEYNSWYRRHMCPTHR